MVILILNILSKDKKKEKKIIIIWFKYFIVHITLSTYSTFAFPYYKCNFINTFFQILFYLEYNILQVLVLIENIDNDIILLEI